MRSLLGAKRAAQQRPCLVGDEKGGYLLAWQDDRNGNWDLYAAPIQAERVIEYTYDGLYRLAAAHYDNGVTFEYAYDAVGNRTRMTSTTPLSGTVVTGYIYDAAGRLAGREVSDGRTYTYTWSVRNELLAEHTQGYPVRTFTWDAAGRMVEATVFTQTTRFTYNGDGNRLAVEVLGQETITYSLDYAAGGRILAEETITGTTLYLYPSASSGPGGRDCLGEYRDSEWLYYLSDAAGYVRQGANEQGVVISAWLFDPDGTLLEGPDGLVSHLVCGGVYDASTGLIYKNGNYFDPTLGIWLMLAPLVVVYSWRGQKKKRHGSGWYALVMLVMGVSIVLIGCGPNPPTPTPDVCIDWPVVSCSMPTSGAEPIYEPAKWNDGLGIQNTNNCYSYAANDHRLHWHEGLPNPGGAAGLPFPYEFPVDCSQVYRGVTADGFVSWPCDAACSSGLYKVMSFVSEIPQDWGDYHFYRQDAGGCWSHKRGQGEVTNVDKCRKLIGDPRLANRDYTDDDRPADYTQFCGCFCVRPGTQTEVYIPGPEGP